MIKMTANCTNNSLLRKAAVLCTVVSITLLPLTINGFTLTTTSSPAALSSSSSPTPSSCLLSSQRDLFQQRRRSAAASHFASHGSTHFALLENRTLYEFDPSTAAAFVDPSSARDIVDFLSGLERDDFTSDSHPDSHSDSHPDSHSEDVDDVVLDLDGRPLTKEFLVEKLNLGATATAAATAASLSSPAKDSFHGFMSNARRLVLLPANRSAFYKSVVFRDLPHAREKLKTAPFKLLRDIRSYGVVADFLSSRARDKLERATGIRIPKCLHADARPDRERPMESKFAFLLEDLAPWEGWYQRWLLCEEGECEAALGALAAMHAFFWAGADFWKKGGEDAEELERSVWKSGSYVQPEAQNTDTVDQCKIVADEWIKKRTKFSKYLSSFDWYDNLGQRLQSVAEECGRLAHPFADIHKHKHKHNETSLSEKYAKYRTFTHGDPKQANIFFRKHPNNNDEKDRLQVGLIDFQWAGFGLAATDIAHFLTSAVHADLLVDGGETRLLRHYYDKLQTHLVEYGAFDDASAALRNYPYETFVEQYEIGVLDICRLMIAYTWSRFEEPVEKGDDDACARTMNKTSYNKSVCTIVWLLSRCDEIMKAKGV